jgi:hypothetical protein
MLLYTVAITVCLQSVPDEQCNYWTTHTEWDHTYAANEEQCVGYAKQVIASAKFDMSGKKARVYCVRTEAIQDAMSQMITAP